MTVEYAAQSNASDAAMKLTNAIAAGKGAPDVCMLEDAMVSQFAVQEGIIELDQFGAQDYADDFVAGPWGKLQVNGKAYGMPLDSAPEVLYYNKAVFDKAGVTEAPTTWDEYYEAAKKIRELGEDYYITNNAGFQPFTAQAWQAGGHMWTVDGENLTIDMTKSEGMQRYIDFTQKLIDEDLINVRINAWSDDWNRSLNDGTLASLTIGAWIGHQPEVQRPGAVRQLARRPAAEVGRRRRERFRGRRLLVHDHRAGQGHHPGVGLRGVRHARRGRAGAHRRGRPVPVPEVDPEQ